MIDGGTLDPTPYIFDITGDLPRRFFLLISKCYIKNSFCTTIFVIKSMFWAPYYSRPGGVHVSRVLTFIRGPQTGPLPSTVGSRAVFHSHESHPRFCDSGGQEASDLWIVEVDLST